MAKRKKGKKGKGKGRGGIPKTNLAQRMKNTGAGRSSGPVSEVNDTDFDQVVESSEVPVLVDFWAPWCGPCKAIAPMLENLANERAGELKVVKYNTEVNTRVASELSVRSIPTLALFKNGEVADVKVGAASKIAIEKWIDKTLNPNQGLLGQIFG